MHAWINLDHGEALAVFCLLAVAPLFGQEPAETNRPPELPYVAGSTTLAVLPDTQYYSQKYPLHFEVQTRWIADSRDLLNIAFVTHLGDIVDSEAEEQQWMRADRAMRLLDGLVPYAVVPGNHDMNSDRGTPLYHRYFPESRFAPGLFPPHRPAAPLS